MKRRLPFRADFEDDDIGAEPSALTELATHARYETFEVQPGGASGSRAVRMVNDPFEMGGIESHWEAMCATGEFEGVPEAFAWDWLKRHRFDPNNYEKLRAYGPAVVVLGAEGDPLVYVQYGGRAGYLSGEEFPDGIKVIERGRAETHVPEVAPSGEFARFELQLDADEETFDLVVNDNPVGTFEWCDSGRPARLAFETGEWGVTGDSKVDNVTITEQ